MKNGKTKQTKHTPHCLRERCCDQGWTGRKTMRIAVDRIRPYIEPKAEGAQAETSKPPAPK